MRANAVILIVIGLLLLVGTVGAEIQVTVVGNSSWLVAGSGSSAAYTVTVKNTTSSVPLVNGATITFSVDPVYGTMNPSSVTTNSAGQAFSTFTVNTKSGTAPIIASISYSGTDGPFSTTVTIPQNIDHGSPFYDFTISPPIFTYPAQGEVATPVSFKVSILDKWKNPIDNRTGNHFISLHATSALSPTEPYFVGYGQDILNKPLDANGNFSVNVMLTTKSGFNSNKILMDTFEGKINSQIAWITTVANSTPYSMTGSISNGGVLPADGISKFTIDYYIYDKYSNPIGNKSIFIYTLPTEPSPYTPYPTSDSDGLIRFNYGPKVSLYNVTITAQTIDNLSVSKILYANFINTNATNMVLAATPYIMGSNEVAPASVAFVTATVIDNFGNPVPGEEVSFSLGSVNNGTYNQTIPPSLSAATNTTDSFGNAMVKFYPGSFAKKGDPGYNGYATGNVSITATWNTTSRSTILTWKNYPYLSVETSASKSNVKLNDTVDITIDVSGNGYAMPGNPIVAVLDQDTSANFYQGHGGADFAKTIKAANAFVDSCTEGLDYVGVTTYSDTTDQIQLIPTAALDYVHMKLGNLTKGNNAQLFNASISHAINNMTQTQGMRPQADKVRAVIVLVDQGGTTLSNATITDLQTQAASTTPFTYLFVVFYDDAGGGTKCNGAAYDTAVKIPNGPNQFRCIGTEADLIAAYRNFSEVLHARAGVNASLMLNFQNVEVNGNSTFGNNVSAYVPNPDPTLPGTGFADLITTPKSRDTIEGRTRIMWQNFSWSVINQSNEWNTGNSPYGVSHQPQQLYFPIGTVNVSEKWNTTYRLRMVNETGLINLFNCSISASQLSFDDGNGVLQPPLCLPNLYITVNENITPVGVQTGTIYLDLLSPNGENYNMSVPMRWDLNYTGFDMVTETYWYSYRTQPFVQFGAAYNIPNGTHTHSIDLDVKNFPAGDYQVKVIASVPGIPSAEDTAPFKKFFDNASVNILLK